MKRLAVLVTAIGLAVVGMISFELNRRNDWVAQVRDNACRNSTVGSQLVLKHCITSSGLALPDLATKEELTDLLIKSSIISPDYCDGWGRPFHFVVVTKNGQTHWSSISAGSDGQFGNTDDIACTFPIP